MNYASVFIATIIDVFSLLLLYGFIVYFAETISYGFVSSMVFVLAFIHVVLSYGIYRAFNFQTTQYDLYASDQDGNALKIE
jgi:hypothetical protein